jgi:hypothetical protein
MPMTRKSNTQTCTRLFRLAVFDPTSSQCHSDINTVLKINSTCNLFRIIFFKGCRPGRLVLTVSFLDFERAGRFFDNEPSHSCTKRRSQKKTSRQSLWSMVRSSLVVSLRKSLLLLKVNKFLNVTHYGYLWSTLLQIFSRGRSVDPFACVSTRSQLFSE